MSALKLVAVIFETFPACAPVDAMVRPYLELVRPQLGWKWDWMPSAS